MKQRSERRKQRSVKKRIIIRGVLELETPTCLSSGDAEADTDLPLLRDIVENKALILGSSIAGAMRSYLESNQSSTSQLFGGTRQTTTGEQSPLIVEDALSQKLIATELRDGVRIDVQTGTAEDKGKYDLELLQAGTKFDLGFELLINEDEKIEASLKEKLAIALHGLEQGHISIGMKKRRGFGQCRVKQWQCWEFDLTDADSRQAWLLFEHHRRCFHKDAENHEHEHIAEALDMKTSSHNATKVCSIEATFTLASPMLIRSGQYNQDKAPDVVHLRSSRSDGMQPKPIISGTSLAGVLRHRAMKIINTLCLDLTIADEIFGTTKKASRLTIAESVIENSTDLVQNRIAIDRFTGGALDGALFAEQPVCPSPKTHVKLRLQLKQAIDSEVGLLLLLLKDLWTGDLTIGGGSSIGRGRLQGRSATISYGGQTYNIRQEDPTQALAIDNPDALDSYVKSFVQSTKKETSA
jgi:CRISPR/Cas system CSM-associated protein Csm3 (group 7 of RAMP superfamily)